MSSTKEEKRHQLYVDLFVELQNDFLAAGYNDRKAFQMAHAKVEHVKEIIEDSLEELSSFYCDIRQVIPLKHIQGWWIKSEGEKAQVLYSLGINVQAPWRERSGLQRGVDGKPTEGLYVEGSERVDPDWIASGHASWEAELRLQEIKHGGEHAYELRQKMAGK